MAEEPHSAPVLGDFRDGWWNVDFLEILAKRYDLRSYSRALDVGCGHGHWGQLLSKYLRPDVQLLGVDREEEWVQKAQARANENGLNASYAQADAHELPFESGAFDLVTCQTVLMHVSDAARVVKEMARVLKPRGRILCAEPAQLPELLALDTVNRQLTPDEMAQLTRLFLYRSRGRIALGDGDENIGEALLPMLTSLGFVDVTVCQNECVAAVFPPYTAKMRHENDLWRSFGEHEFWMWNKEQTRDYFEAGGGDASEFEDLYAVFAKQTELRLSQMESQTFSAAGGGSFYVVSGIKPGVS